MKKLFIFIATIITIVGLVKLYHFYGRPIGYRFFYSQELIKAFAEADVSMHPNVDCTNSDHNNWLISYADKNPWFMNQNALSASAVNKCIDVIKIYRRRHIDKSYLKLHENILNVKRGGGYWLWKPYLVLKTLREMPENDVLLYLDTGIIIKEPIDSYVEALGDKDIGLFIQVFKNKSYTTKKLFKIMNMDNERAFESGQINASRLIFRNTPKARAFVEEWLHWCETPGALDDSDDSDEYPEFVDHRHDQAVLSLTYLKNLDKVKILDNANEKYFFHHRRHYFDRHSLVFTKEILSKFETWLSKSVFNLLHPQ